MGGIVTPGFKTGFYSPRRGGVPKYPSLWRSCVGAWCPSLGQTGSTLHDQSLNQNHGTLTSMESSDWFVSDGKLALDFDGSGEYVNTPETWLNKIGTGDFAICAWVYTDTLATRQMVYAKDVFGLRSFALSINEGSGGIYSSGSMAVAICQSDSSVFLKYADGVIFANRWIHILAMRSSGVISIWINGVVVPSNGVAFGGATENAAIQVTSAASRIGARQYSGAEDYFNGRIDDVRAYNRPFAPSEARLLASRRGIAYELSTKRNFFVAGSPPITGDLSATLASLTLSASGTVAAGASGTVTATLGSLSLVSAGTVAAGASGDTSVTLAAVTLTSTGTVAAGATGSVTITLADVTLSATGAEASTATGSVSATLGAVTLSATGTVADGATGSVSATLGAVTVSSTGTVAAGASGSVSATLGSLSLASGGSLSAGLTAQVNQALEACVVSSTGTVAAGTTGVLSVQLASVVLVSQGTFVLPGGFRLKVAGTWKDATAFIKVGDWQQATPYIKVNGVWK